MNIRKSLAGIAAGSLALAGIAVATAPAASAAPPPATLVCNIFSNSLAFQSNWAQSSTLTVNNAPQGGTLNLNWTSDTGLFNGSPTAIGAGSTQAQVLVELSGSVVGNVLLTSAPGTYPGASVPSGGTMPGFSATASVAVPANATPGTVTATVKQFVFNSTADNYCSPTAGNYPAVADPLVSSLTFLTPPVIQTTPVDLGDAQVSATSTTVASTTATISSAPTISIAQFGSQSPFVPAARSGDTGTVNLSNFAAGPPTTAELCAYTGPGGPTTGCVAQTLNSANATVASVTLSSVSAIGTPYYLRLSNGVDPAARAFIAIYGTQTLTLSPANGPAGTTTTVSGSNWNAGQSVTVEALDASNALVGSAISGLTVNNSGAWTTTANAVTVAANVVSVRASQSTFPAGTNTQSQAWQFLVSACTQNPTGVPCDTQQVAKVTIDAGSLSQAATATGAANTTPLEIVFGSTDVSTTPTPLPGDFNTVRVTDARGATTGWSLTATLDANGLDEINNGTGNIPATALAFTAIGCGVVGAGSAALEPTSVGTPVANLSITQTLCTKGATTNAGGSTSGSYDVTGELELTVPAFQKVADYEGTITVTLT
jgi:hypothetical protein